MGRPGRPKPPLVEKDEDRAVLERWARRRSTAQGLALRARIVLASAEGRTNAAVAQELGVHPVTVGKWRARYLRHGPGGLGDEPRPGAPRRVSGEQVEQVVVATLEQAPPDATHRSTRAMAKRTGLSQSTISRIWRAFGLPPHRTETRKLSADPNFVAKVRDVVGLYLDPPEHALVLCVDEKTQMQATERTAPVLPMVPGTPERRSHDDRRHGTTALFAASDAASGRVIGRCQRRHRHREFRRFLDRIDAEVPADLDVHLVVDNDATHKTEAIRRWLLRHPRFHVHFTPTYSSWLNLVERWFAEPTTKQLRRACTAASRSSSKPSPPGSTPGTRTPGRSRG